jgi:hypothetical protein
MAHTTADFDKMTTKKEWLGSGYLGERATQREQGRDTSEADEKAIAEANRLGLTDAELFDWANSKNGRWYGDCMFGNHGQHAERYAPGQPQRSTAFL